MCGKVSRKRSAARGSVAEPAMRTLERAERAEGGLVPEWMTWTMGSRNRGGSNMLAIWYCWIKSIMVTTSAESLAAVMNVFWRPMMARWQVMRLVRW